MFFLYGLLGKKGVVAFFLLFGLFMGYVGFCQVRALLSRQRRVLIDVKKGNLILAGGVLAFFVLTGDRPSRRTADRAPLSPQANPSYEANQPPVTQPVPEVRQRLGIEQISQVYRDALKERPDLGMTLQEFSRYAQDNQKDYDFSEGIAYSPPNETAAPKPAIRSSTATVAQEQANIGLKGRQTQLRPRGSSDISEAGRNEKVESSSLVNPRVASEPTLKADGRDFFTVGSSREDVVAIQGEPSDSSETKMWYGRSVVCFADGRVVNWSSDGVKLKARYWTASKSQPKDYFTAGSGRDEVLELHGSPTSFTSNYVQYGKSSVWFKYGQVTDWTNVDFKLNGRR